MLQVPLGSQQEPRVNAQGFGSQMPKIVHRPSHWTLDTSAVHEPVVEQQAPGGSGQSVVVQAMASPW
jgi:hypothetical protein